MGKRKILFTSHIANFQKFNRPLMRMLRGTLKEPYKDLNMGGWIVDYASAGEEEIKDADHAFKVDFSRNPLRFDKHIKAHRQLRKIIAEGNYEVIHTHSPVGSIITRWAAKSAHKKGLKIIYTCHGFQFYKGGPKRDWRLFYPVEKRMARVTDLLITINTEDYKLVKKQFGCPVKMIDGVGVETANFAKKYSKKEMLEAREKYGLDADDFVIVYLAEFRSVKNHQRLIESLEPIIRADRKVKLLCLGKGKLMDAARKQARRLGIEDNIVMPGYIRDQYAALVAGCDLCVSAAYQEGLGLGVLECIASGLPIIIADTRGHRDIVNNDKKYLFDPLDTGEMTRKIRAAIRNPEKYHLKFDEKYSLRNSLSEMRKIYEDFLG
ncbi:glycosyltransferase [Candidatus Saccharibacteria bacterium]|nr:glycosyltransferase [Candidatus Saccharibacteria bacterium]